MLITFSTKYTVYFKVWYISISSTRVPYTVCCKWKVGIPFALYGKWTCNLLYLYSAHCYALHCIIRSMYMSNGYYKCNIHLVNSTWLYMHIVHQSAFNLNWSPKYSTCMMNITVSLTVHCIIQCCIEYDKYQGGPVGNWPFSC